MSYESKAALMEDSNAYTEIIIHVKSNKTSMAFFTQVIIPFGKIFTFLTCIIL